MDYSKIYVMRIQTLCKQRGISINKLATMSDVKQSTLDNIVRGVTKNPRVKTLHKIAIALNMTISEFLDFDELNVFSFDDDEDEINKYNIGKTLPVFIVLDNDKEVLRITGEKSEKELNKLLEGVI